MQHVLPKIVRLVFERAGSYRLFSTQHYNCAGIVELPTRGGAPIWGQDNKEGTSSSEQESEEVTRGAAGSIAEGAGDMSAFVGKGC